MTVPARPEPPKLDESAPPTVRARRLARWIQQQRQDPTVDQEWVDLVAAPLKADLYAEVRP